MYILSRKEMQFYDSLTINNFKMPGRILMENAGRGCSYFIETHFGDDLQKVIVFCGSGNNGGDGFVIARWLKNRGKQVVVIHVDKQEKLSEDSLANFKLLTKLQIPIFKIHNYDEWVNINMTLRNFDLIIDAIFGIGFRGKLEDWRKDLIAEINAVSTTKVSIDVASGIDINTGMAQNAIIADYTLTMEDYKFGHFIGQGRINSGIVHKIPIGIPFQIYQQYQPHAYLVNSRSIIYPKRKFHFYKKMYGKVGILAGSPGYTGAAIMAGRAALKSGSGLITLYHEKDMGNIFENQLIEIMTKELPELNDDWNVKQIVEMLDQNDVLLVGPGWGVNDRNKKLLEEILWTWKKPLVLDADALTIISEDERLLKKLAGKPIILTPHYGEFARLLHKTVEDLKADPVNYVIKFAKKYDVRILLKSISTIYTDGKQIKIDISGNDGLATGGSGDVLAGIIASFLAQSLSIDEAPISASYLLGKTAEKLAEEYHTSAINPSLIIDNLFKK